MTDRTIEFFFDPVSPFSYLASTRIDEIAARHGRPVVWRPVLIGITILKVMGLKPIPQTPLKSLYSWQDAERLAAMLDVPLVRHGLEKINSLAACRAHVWLAEREPAQAQALAKRLSAALWTERKDITPVETVVAEAAALGIDTTGMEQAVGSEAVKQQLSAAVDYAIGKGVFGVPFFIVDGQQLWGNDRLWMLEFWLRHSRWPRLDEWLGPRPAAPLTA